MSPALPCSPCMPCPSPLPHGTPPDRGHSASQHSRGVADHCPLIRAHYSTEHPELGAPLPLVSFHISTDLGTPPCMVGDRWRLRLALQHTAEEDREKKPGPRQSLCSALTGCAAPTASLCHVFPPVKQNNRARTS